jgi:hypothetical protein
LQQKSATGDTYLLQVSPQARRRTPAPASGSAAADPSAGVRLGGGGPQRRRQPRRRTPAAAADPSAGVGRGGGGPQRRRQPRRRTPAPASGSAADPSGGVRLGGGPQRRRQARRRTPAPASGSAADPSAGVRLGGGPQRRRQARRRTPAPASGAAATPCSLRGLQAGNAGFRPPGTPASPGWQRRLPPAGKPLPVLAGTAGLVTGRPQDLVGRSTGSGYGTPLT